MIDFKRTEKMFKASGAIPKACYFNSVNAAMESGEEGLLYVEGFCATTLGIPFEHGWLVSSDGIVDVTYFSLANNQRELASYKYSPVFTYTIGEILASKIFKSNKIQDVSVAVPVFSNQKYWQWRYPTRKNFTGPMHKMNLTLFAQLSEDSSKVNTKLDEWITQYEKDNK